MVPKDNYWLSESHGNYEIDNVRGQLSNTRTDQDVDSILPNTLKRVTGTIRDARYGLLSDYNLGLVVSLKFENADVNWVLRNQSDIRSLLIRTQSDSDVDLATKTIDAYFSVHPDSALPREDVNGMTCVAIGKR